MFNKKLAGLALALTLAMPTLPVFAAETETGPLVFVDGQKIPFDVSPSIEEGTTLVQFRPIFEKLGLTVGWDESTRTVTGKKEGLSIELQIDSQEAKVNGQAYTMAIAPRIIDGNTLVPLRFVGESTGKDVHWDGYTQSIRIAEAKDNIRYVVDSNTYYTKTENTEGFFSTVARESSSAGAVQTLLQLFKTFDLDYTRHSVVVHEVKDETAVATLDITATKINGPEFKNNRTTSRQMLVKENGSWKFLKAIVQKIDLLNGDLFKDEKPNIPEADRKAVLDLFEKARVLSEEENFDALLELYDPNYPNLETLFNQSKSLAASVDLKFEYSDINLIQARNNSVLVRFKQKTTIIADPKVPDTVTETVRIVKKLNNGRWVLGIAETLTTEVLLPE